ncbi:TraR/DksA C4-type zinc finger protein [uncultured Tessaracoccus sp.]|uniref:TraR/DksA family transcriptional regulator n=1 Tax=uncultured Tessaracoccus sp. TaxID=905023 RepID=UPI0025FB73C4|nr:TraR/DksA C4-type zinc finger protein [uncultured Tessaracoccus sp.]
MADLDLDEIADELEQKASDLRARIAELTRVVNADETISFGKRIGDGTTQAIQQMADTAAAESLHATLLEVEAAQQRLADGTFGRCTVCGKEIPAGRLEFRPWAATCVEHAD